MRCLRVPPGRKRLSEGEYRDSGHETGQNREIRSCGTNPLARPREPWYGDIVIDAANTNARFRRSRPRPARETHPVINGWTVIRSEFVVRFVAASDDRMLLAHAHRIVADMIVADTDAYVERYGVDGRAAIVFEASHRASEIDTTITLFETVTR